MNTYVYIILKYFFSDSERSEHCIGITMYLLPGVLFFFFETKFLLEILFRFPLVVTFLKRILNHFGELRGHFAIFVVGFFIIWKKP